MNKQTFRSVMVGLAFFTSCLASSIANAGLLVEFNMNFGAFEVELFDTQTPISVANFLSYANSGAYDNTVIHRSINNFVIQGGGYLTTGAPIPTSGTIADEIGISNLRGTIAYANTGSPNSATSQWYFNTVDNTFLDTGYTVFGQIRGTGMTIVDQINALPTVNIGGPFTNLPVINPSNPLFESNLAFIHSITTVPSLAAVPEPGSIWLLSVGLAVAAFRSRRRTNG